MPEDNKVLVSEDVLSGLNEVANDLHPAEEPPHNREPKVNRNIFRRIILRVPVPWRRSHRSSSAQDNTESSVVPSSSDDVRYQPKGDLFRSSPYDTAERYSSTEPAPEKDPTLSGPDTGGKDINTAESVKPHSSAPDTTESTAMSSSLDDVRYQPKGDLFRSLPYDTAERYSPEKKPNDQRGAEFVSEVDTTLSGPDTGGKDINTAESAQQQENIQARQEGKPLPYPDAQGVKLPNSLKYELLTYQKERDRLIALRDDIGVSDEDRRKYEIRIGIIENNITRLKFPTPEERNQLSASSKESLRNDVREMKKYGPDELVKGMQNELDKEFKELDVFASSTLDTDEASKNILNKVMEYKLPLIGSTVKDYLISTSIGGSTGFVARTAVKSGVKVFLGIGATPVVTIGAGAVAGGVSSMAREYWLKMRKDTERSKRISELREQYKDRNRFKREIMVSIKAGDLERLGKAGLRGAVTGAIGGILGYEAADWMKDHIDLSSVLDNIKHHIPTGGSHDSSVSFTPKPDTTSIPTPDKTVTITDIPNHQGLGLTNHSTPIPTETPTPLSTPTLSPVGSPAESLTPTPVHPLSTGVLPSAHEGITSGHLGSTDITKPLVSPSTAPNLNGTSSLSRVASGHSLTSSPSATNISQGHVTGSENGAGSATTPSGEHFRIPENIVPKDGIIPLPPDSNPWDMTAKIGQQVLGRPLTPEETLKLTKAVASQSKISVSEWGINGPGFVDEHNLPPGYKLVINKKVLDVLMGFPK